MRQEFHIPSRGQHLHAVLDMPDTPGRHPGLLICHGFTGNSGEEGFFRITEEACENGFAVLRMDFAGSGKSTGDFTECTYLQGWKEDILSAAEWMAQSGYIDGTRMAVLGHSMGGAAAVAAAESGAFTALAGWAPVLDMPVTFRKIIGKDHYEYLLGHPGETYSSVYDGAEYTVNSRFVRDAEEAGIPGSVMNSRAERILFLTGDMDPVVDTGTAEGLWRKMPGKVTAVTIRGEDHSMMHHHGEVVRRTLEFILDAAGKAE